MAAVPTVKYMMQRFPHSRHFNGNRPFTREIAKQIRKLLEGYETKHLRRRPTPKITLGKVNELLGGHGVETIPKGNNEKSPEIVYVNMGDTYDVTVMWVNSRFVVGDWGAIVEQGDYP